MADTVTDLDKLAAVFDHARRHGLAGTILTVGVALDPATVHIPSLLPRSGRRAMAWWARSIAADGVLVTDQTYTAHGGLDSGLAVTVTLSRYGRRESDATVVAIDEFEAAA